MAAANLPRLAEFAEDFNMWFRKFELFVTVPGDPAAANQRHQVLPYFLIGRAFLMIDALPDDTKADYVLAKAALRARLVPDEHNLSKNFGESIFFIFLNLKMFSHVFYFQV
jgi:hypothetical protein